VSAAPSPSIEELIASSGEVELFALARVAHEFAMLQLRESEGDLEAAIQRAERARGHAERAGELLTQAIRLRELVR